MCREVFDVLDHLPQARPLPSPQGATAALSIAY